MKLRNAAAVGSMIVALIGLSVIDVQGAENTRELTTEHVDLAVASHAFRASSPTMLILEAEQRGIVVVEISGRTPESLVSLAAGDGLDAEVLEASPGRWILALPQAGSYELHTKASGPFEVRIEAYRGRAVQPQPTDALLSVLEMSTELPGEPPVEEPVEEPVDDSSDPISPDGGELSGGGGGGGGSSEPYNEDPVTLRWAPNQPDGQPGTRSATARLQNALVELPELGIWMRVEQHGALRLPLAAQARVYALCQESTSRLHLCAKPMAQGTLTQGDLRAADARRLHTFTLAATAQVILEGTGEPDLRGHLYDAAGRFLAVDDDSGTALGFRFELQLPAGRYVLEVDAVDGGAGPYTLRLETDDTRP